MRIDKRNWAVSDGDLDTVKKIQIRDYDEINDCREGLRAGQHNSRVNHAVSA